MRFLMMMIPAGYQGAAGQKVTAEFAPEPEAVSKMMAYNEELGKAGALLALDGLTHPSQGYRVSYKGGQPKVSDGPFAESKEVVGGFWIIQTNTKEEAIEWAKKVPVADEDDIVELRPIFGDEDYPEEIKEALKDTKLEMGVQT